MQKFCVGALLVIVIACSKDDVTLTDVDTTIIAWLDTMNVDSATADASGIYYYATTENPTGIAATAGSVVSIYYTLRDLSGNVIASHLRSDGDSLVLKQGVSAVYPVGLDLGLAFMREGETFNIIIPPALGYQDLTSGAIAPNMISLLEVEIARVQNEVSVYAQETADITNYITSENLNDTIANPLNSVQSFASGVAYKRIVKGFGPFAVNGETVILSYTASFLSNTTFDSKNNFQFILGSTEPRLLIQGFEFGLSIMAPNERALIIVPSSQGYRESALIIPRSITADLIEDDIIPDYVQTVPPYTPMVFDVTRFD
ncbi:MAG: FKBP-type peptidyl-prolyl cis-trans isomerase [Cyclobacteriaceae bacterium]